MIKCSLLHFDMFLKGFLFNLLIIMPFNALYSVKCKLHHQKKLLAILPRTIKTTTEVIT